MKAARFYAPRDVRLEDVPEPEVGPGELLIEVLASDMCGTDLKTFMRGHPLIKPPITIGHEYSGVVKEAGRGAKFRRGDRIVASNSAPCMKCEMCKRGSYTLCSSITEGLVGFSVPGSYSEYLLVPRNIAEVNTYRFKRSKPEEIACSEPLASVIHALDRVQVERGERVAIVGAGALGLMFLQLLKAKGAEVIVANRSGGRLEVASRLGADSVIQVDDGSLADRVRTATGGLGADVVVEAVGRKETWESAFGAARNGGRVLQFGGCASGTRVEFDAGKIHYGETSVIGSFHHEPTAFRRAVRAIESGEVKTKPLITHRVSLDEIRRGFELMERGEALKVAVLP
ncbi:MAG: zinc-binding dehydrogenase [Nitrososphaerales archaeon]|nr:zinc-binding dehydrogenase [Nitrososphaerales archaeon]